MASDNEEKNAQAFFSNLNVMNVDDQVIDLFLKNKHRLNFSYDALDPNDQEILRNKLSALQGLLEEKSYSELSNSEKDWMINLFRTKN